MPNYQLGKIYKIVDNTNGNIYIGSTSEPRLSRRLSKHVTNYKQYLNDNSHFVTSFKIIENGNYDIVLIENCPCNSKDELHKRERYYIETIKCINKVIPQRTNKQYREDNKDKINQQRKQKNICECGGKHSYDHKQQHLKTKKHKQYVSSL